MTLFHDFLEGTFDNRLQAMHYPTRYARIIVEHKWIGGDWFEGKQYYYHSPNEPRSEEHTSELQSPMYRMPSSA